MGFCLINSVFVLVDVIRIRIYVIDDIEKSCAEKLFFAPCHGCCTFLHL